MKTSFTYLLIIICCMNACAQKNAPAEIRNKSSQHVTDSFTLLSIIPGNFSDVEVDAVGNIYLLTSANQLKKLSSSGDSLAVFNDVRRYGNVSYIDVSNPLRTLVYYKNFSTIIILDRLLSVRTTLNLRKNQIFKVNAVTTSYDNNLWIFDEQDIKLKKINEEGKILMEGNDLRLLSEKIPAAAFIYDVENFVYVYDPQQGFFIFDQYAAFKNIIPLLNWNSVAVTKKSISGITSGKLNFFDIEKNESRSYVLPGKFSKARQFKSVNNRIYILDDDGLRIYMIP